MIPLYRIIEICVYSLLNFLPFMALALYHFRSRLRFSVKITVCIIVVISFIQMGLGLWADFFSGGKAALASAVSTAVYVVFYFIAVKVNFGKALFTLLMISNTANFVVAASKCIEGKIFPELAVQSYRWSFSLIMLVVLAVVWIPLFIYTKKVYTPAVEKEPTGIEWRYLWLIPATFYLIWYYMLYNNNGKSSLETALDTGNTVFLLFINVGAGIVYYVIAMLINEQEKNIRLSDNNHRLAMQNLQYENLQEKIADAVISGGPPANESIRSLMIANLPECVALPLDHPYANNDILDMRDLKNEKFIAMARSISCSGFESIIQKSLAAGFEAQIVAQVDLLPTLMTMVACGQGISILHRDMLPRSNGRIAFVPLRSVSYFRRWLMWDINNDNPCLQPLIALGHKWQDDLEYPVE